MKHVLAVVFLFVMPSFGASQERMPANAHKNILGTGWECNRGFAQRGGECVPVRVPPNAELDVFGHDWQCRRGYAQVAGACSPVQIPANAHLDVFGHGWECDRGFRQQAGSCVSFAMPAHAHLNVFGHGWECDNNYKQQDGGCTVMSPQEVQEAQRRDREMVQRLAERRRALDSVDWSACNDELDRLRRRCPGFCVSEVSWV